ncbi:hypothetical protein GWK47_052503 [Chionoecetes opilio]|uniref:Uncharacterized protein n=1 Tax=Chionoecetes opilio TaxID=41210 RepID=A0A8J4Y1L7_CHIOP|nr:hypothetical protein GWK47_052503 [Chionoecetes opilio]
MLTLFSLPKCGLSGKYGWVTATGKNKGTHKPGSKLRPKISQIPTPTYHLAKNPVGQILLHTPHKSYTLQPASDFQTYQDPQGPGVQSLRLMSSPSSPTYRVDRKSTKTIDRGLGTSLGDQLSHIPSLIRTCNPWPSWAARGEPLGKRSRPHSLLGASVGKGVGSRQAPRVGPHQVPTRFILARSVLEASWSQHGGRQDCQLTERVARQQEQDLVKRVNRDISKRVRSLLEEQEAKILAAIDNCQKVKAQLNQYETTVRGWGRQQQDLEDRLQSLVDQCKDVRMLARQEELRASDKRQQIDQGEQQLHTVLQTVRKAASAVEACETIEDADHVMEEETQREEECLAMFPDVHTVITLNKRAILKRASGAGLLSIFAGNKLSC